MTDNTLIRNRWLAVEFGHAVGNAPVRIRLGSPDEDHTIALFRDGDGVMRAIDDRCPHRGASLATGSVRGGCLECPYHGWRFSGSGRCALIPSQPAGRPIPKAAHLAPIRCIERFGFVFVLLDADGGEPPLPDLKAEGLTESTGAHMDGFRVISGDFEWEATDGRVIENAIDIAHTPFVHRASFGNLDQPMVQDHEVDLHLVDDHLMSFSATVDLAAPPPSGLWGLGQRERPPTRTRTGVYPPNITVLDITTGIGQMKILTAVVPRPGDRATSKWMMFRSFFRHPAFDRNARRRAHRVFVEDQPVVESQRPRRVPLRMSDEIFVDSDALQLTYRRWRRDQRPPSPPPSRSNRDDPTESIESRVASDDQPTG